MKVLVPAVYRPHYALNLLGQPGGHGDAAAAELLRGLGDDFRLLGSDLAVPGQHPDVEDILIPLVLQAAQRLDPLDFFGTDFFLGFHWEHFLYL